MHAHLLEDGAGGPVRARPPQDPATQRVGPPRAGGAHQHAAALRQDDQREHVRGRDVLRRARRRAEHLLDVQAHLAEAAAQRAEVPHGDRAARPRGKRIQGHPAEHGGDRAAGPRRHVRRPHRQLVPVEGESLCVETRSRHAFLT